MDPKQLSQICGKHFKFLEKKYGFVLVKEAVDSLSYEFWYKSNTVGIKVKFEFPDFYLFVKLCRLQNEGFPPKPGEIRPETQLESFDLDDVLTIRSKESLIPSYSVDTKFDKALLEDVVRKQAINLKKFATDIIKGDFSLFPELDKIVKKRAKQAAFQKWGDKAADFGWNIEYNSSE
jgi:hypothetical protein